MKVYNLLKRLADSWCEDEEALKELERLGIYLTSEQKVDLLRSDVEDFMRRNKIMEVKDEPKPQMKVEANEGTSLKVLFSAMDIEQTLKDYYSFLKKKGYSNLIYTPLRPRSIYEGEVIKEVQIEDLTFVFLQHKIKRSYSYGLVEKGIREEIRKKMALITWLHTYNALSREFLKQRFGNVKIDINTFQRHLLAMVYINMNSGMIDRTILMNNVDYFILSHTPKSNLKFYISNANLVLQEQTKLIYEIRRIIKNSQP